MQALLQSCERSSLRVHYRARSDFFFLLPFLFSLPRFLLSVCRAFIENETMVSRECENLPRKVRQVETRISDDLQHSRCSCCYRLKLPGIGRVFDAMLFRRFISLNEGSWSPCDANETGYTAGKSLQ